jgi:hypothetical protein
MTVLGHRSSTATSGFAVVGGVAGHGASLPEVTSVDAFVTARGDHLGLPLAMRGSVLAYVLPYGTTLYAGLFTEMPDRLGVGGTELDVDRVSISRWTNFVRGANVRRSNATSMRFEALAAAATLVGWCVWTASSGGTLRAFDFLRNEADEPVTHEIAIGVSPGIAAGRIGLVL